MCLCETILQPSPPFFLTSDGRDKKIKEKRDRLAQSATDCNRRKHMQKLNDSLELAAKRFASQIAENKKARAEINELRHERKRFEQINIKVQRRACCHSIASSLLLTIHRVVCRAH
jgi:DNA primase